MTWHQQNANFNTLIRQVFHEKDIEKRAEAARQIGFLKDGRAVNLLCRALKSEKDLIVVNRIIEAMGRIGDGRCTLIILEKLKEELKNDDPDKLKLIYIIESLMRINDKRALPYIGYFLNSEDNELRNLSEKAFDVIEPKWREIVRKERREKSIQEIFRINL
ncbi:MAG: HEAT repeat domain-containing protein [Candidatus Hodarchaeota archaeon]